MPRRYKYIGIVTAAALALPAIARAKVDLVTLPQSDRTELTIYNSADLTMVRETRTLSFKPGENRIQFSWADTKIDPTSLKLNTDRSPALTLEETIYPANTKDLAVWVVRATGPTSAPVDISYFSAGLSWEASYQVRTDAAETTFRMQQTTKLTNRSGQDFEHVNARAVVGEVRLLEAIYKLATNALPTVVISDKVGDKEDAASSEYVMRFTDEFDLGAYVQPGTGGRANVHYLFNEFSDSGAVVKQAREIVKQAVSEYYLFAIQGETDLKDGWAQSMPNPPVADVPFDLSYELDPTRYGPLPVKFYKLKNDEAHKLGKDPLPAGKWQVVRDDGRGGIALEGMAEHKYIPKGEKVELNLGSDGLVIAKETLLAAKRENFTFRNTGDIGGWDDVQEVLLETRNSRARPVPYRLTKIIFGDWEFDDVSEKNYERVDKQTVRWELTLPAETTTTIRCRIRTHCGDNAKSN